MTQDRNGVPTIGQRYLGRTQKDEDRLRWQGLANLWCGYADIMDKLGREGEAKDARIKASGHLFALLVSLEEEDPEYSKEH